MKNATKYAEVLKPLCRKLVREYKPQPKVAIDPLPALVRGAMSFDVPDAKASGAMDAIEKEFVDLNELRVATDLEIQELLGQRYPKIEDRVAMITSALNAIFEREHTMSLERLKTISKRDARQFLRELPDMHPFVEAYVMQFGFDAPAFPIDDEMRSYLLEEEAIDPEATLDEIQRFIEHQLKAEELIDLFFALRIACYEDGKRKKRK